jgi:hypothetical protein
MGQGDFYNLLHRGDKGDSRMGGLAAGWRLKGETSETSGITGWSGGKRGLPPLKKEVFRCETVVAQRTMREMPEQAILGILSQRITNLDLQCVVVLEESRMPVRIRIQTDPRYPETVFPPPDGAIGPEGENRFSVFQPCCGEEKSQKARRQKGSHRCALNPPTIDFCFLYSHKVFRRRVPSHGMSAGKREDLATFG